MPQTANVKSPSVEKQLIEVYSLVDQLHQLTEEVRAKVDSVLNDVAEQCPSSDEMPETAPTGAPRE